MAKKRKPKAAPKRAAEAEENKPLPGGGTSAGVSLQAAHDAFTRGDFAAVREHADALQETDDPEVRAAALRLRKRTEIDPVQIGIWAACFLFFLYVVFEYV